MNIAQIRALLESNPTTAELEAIALDERAGVQKIWQKYLKAKDAETREYTRFTSLLSFERSLGEECGTVIAGIDEAGRGPLAGPLVTAAVILPPDVFIKGLDDSKKLSAHKRESLYQEILQVAVAIVVGIVSVEDVDRYNIYQATKRSMEDIASSLQPVPGGILVDAMPLEIKFAKIVSLIHGDALSASIAAASVMAKVTRDRLMAEIDTEYPQYGFAGNKGYGSAEHLRVLSAIGPSPWHRQSYEPVKSLVQSGKFVYKTCGESTKIILK